MTESHRTVAAAEPTSLYLYYDQNSLLLYVGITKRGISRNHEHNSTKEWWRFVARQEVQHFPDRPQALRAERQMIETYRPPFNVQHNPDHKLMREAYLQLRAEGRLPSRATAQQGLKWLPLEFVNYDGSRFLYVTPSSYSDYVRNLDADRYGFLCSLKSGKASISRELDQLWVTIRGKAGQIRAPRLRVTPAPGKRHSFRVKGIDLLGDGVPHPEALRWSTENGRELNEGGASDG